ncbi:formylglycine-generating enzyme family protein [Streptomyces jumonjinensis]|uniref:Formylglycine-generating enzyme family protein n=1 Tax=Streptomyces jumonjinensis TaxID=1945 RepID=A0A646KSV7_STRJU|nr:SUMF1/EgtB/PvdO family nonheme iron enzyme [Streptomyces jumonjinensis]MQT05412.1 formylglycine-generating enzyme family protein [Streptomyces jumonjinensis]
MTGVTRWTGQEVALLRQAMRQTGRDFAAMVGVSNRQLTTWESRGATIELRPGNQATLDTLLARAGIAAQRRFAALLTERAAAAEDQRTEELLRRDPRMFKHPLDGKLMVRVEEGIFLSGPKNVPTWADSFLIDVYPTTNADYARFVTATGHRPPRHWPQGRCPEALRDHPVVWVDWNDAAAYVRWCGKGLPTSQQWEKAARGRNGREYPWGDEPTAAKCNTSEAEIGQTTPVTRYQSGVSPYGVYDMCGNCWEWCATQAPQEPGRFELKGSAFTSPVERARPSLRNAANTTMQDNDTGFRCVTSA